MVTFVALYRGLTAQDAQLIAVSTDSAVIRAVANELLGDALDPEAAPAAAPATNIRQALRIVMDSADGDPSA
jgi:hypothetical protein